MNGPKLDGENPKAMAVTNGQTLMAEPLSSSTDDTLRPEQATSMNKGRTWSDPSGGKSLLENTMHVALSAVRKWISPLGGGSSINSNMTESSDQCVSMCAG